jgi:hypothetical protein
VDDEPGPTQVATGKYDRISASGTIKTQLLCIRKIRLIVSYEASCRVLKITGLRIKIITYNLASQPVI